MMLLLAGITQLLKEFFMKFILLLILLTGCASNTTILEADALCNHFKSKSDYRNCLAEAYEQNKKEQESTFENILKFLNLGALFL